MTNRRVWATTTAALLALSVGVGVAPARNDDDSNKSSAVTGRWGQRVDDIDLAASALSSPDGLNVRDDAYDEARSRRRAARVDTTSSAASTCDDCTAEGTALHIVYVDRPSEAVLDNVAAAWATCTGCRATTLSVQVVIVRQPQTVQANNRALAVNAACERCRTEAAAFQLVVIGDRKDRLSWSARQELKLWVEAQAADLRGEAGIAATADGDESPAAAALDELEALVTGELGGGQAIERDVDVQTTTPDADDPAPDATSATPSPLTQPSTEPSTEPTADPAAIRT